MPSWMLARLKRETQCHLAAANEDRLSLLATKPTADSYRAYLTRIYGFESRVEAAFLRTRQLDQLVDLRGRTHLQLLRADLQALGVAELERIASCPTVALASAGEALGWMYAIDHNGLLHGEVRRRLHNYLPREVAFCGAYLDGTCRALGARLQELGAGLDACARDPATAKTIVDAAKLAFRRQHHWFVNPGRSIETGVA